MNIQLTPYLLLDGKANEAIDFYTNVFDADIESRELLKDWPQEFDHHIPEGYENNVMHAHLNIGQSQLMLADTLPGQTMKQGSTITIMIDVKEVSDARRLFSALLVDGEETMALQESSFSPAMGQVKDKFGIEWQIITEHPDMREGPESLT
ncbi:VOC family protein [Amphibacillus sp. Q70]|uniref:VOC family protein n=1 Tax=Amphibacillus sp. Q70 TaxID=3453416 RepID=UPI003F878634